MGWLLATLAAVVPEGPLHPAIAVGGVVVGVSAAAVAGRNGGRWLSSVVLGAALLATQHDTDLVSVVSDRPDRGMVLTTIVVVSAAGVLARMRRATAIVVALSACLGVWAVVPDTELALIGASVLGGAGAVAALPRWLPDRRRAVHATLLLLPLWAAAAGSIGRPGRFGPGLLVGALTAGLGLASWRLMLGLWRRQRAGTPITVAPGATSSTTTAPAPTTAS